MRRGVRYLLLAVVFILLAGYLLTGVTRVRPGERAVVRRFGRVLEQKPEPGLYVGLPWGMERVDRVPVDLVRHVEFGYRPNEDEPPSGVPNGQLLTGDHNLVNVRIVVNWTLHADRVEDYVAHLDEAGRADRIDALVARAAEAVVAEWVAGRNVDDVLLRGKAELPRWLAGAPARRLEKRLAPYRLGIQIQDATVAYLLPPDEVKDAFDQVTRAQTAIRTKVNEAEQEAERGLREAEAEKYQREQQAAAYAREQELLAKAEADSFRRRLGQYRRLRKDNPDVLASIWWDEMGKALLRLKDDGRIDLLDHHLGADGLTITQFPPLPKK